MDGGLEKAGTENQTDSTFDIRIRCVDFGCARSINLRTHGKI